MRPMSSPCTSTGDRLALEWVHLHRRSSVLRRAATWQVTDGPITSLDDVLRAVGFEARTDPRAEGRLHRLVLIAADDELAARVVVQRLLPGLLAVVRRRRALGPVDGAFDELLGAAWIAIRTYNPARRPTCLAAALISDADYAAFRAAHRRRSAAETPVEPRDRPEDRHPSASEELADVLATALAAGVERDELALLQQLLDTPRVVDLARQLDVTPRTIRNRRDRIALRLREVALAA